MKSVAYLTNQYPTPTHSFIRREIAALESLGWQVHRFSHRRCEDAITDPADEVERARTIVLMDAGPRSILAAVLRSAISDPLRWMRALALTISMACSSHRPFAAHLGYFGLACKLAEELQLRGNPHLHVHHCSNPADVALLCHRLRGQTFSMTAHGPEFAAGDRINFEHKIETAGFVVVVSEHGRRMLQSRYTEHLEKALLVHCGLDDAWLDRPPTPIPNTKQLLYIARLEAEKNPELLLRAAAVVRRDLDSFRIVIAGDGTLRPHLGRLIEELRISEQITLLGWCNQQQLMTSLEESCALVLSSNDEGLPVAIMEACALARPSIATDVGGVSELVEPAKTGWLVPAGNREALAAAMLQCLTAPVDTLQSMGNAARDRAREFSALDSAKRLSSAFSERHVGRRS